MFRYVGSPYQTSLSEAGQDKFFYLVGRGAASNPSPTMSHTPAPMSAVLEGSVEPKPGAWRELERWTVNIGSKIIKVLVLIMLITQQ